MIGRHWVTLLGLVVAVLGGVLLALARTDQFGWTSYSSMPAGVNTSGVWVFEQGQAAIGLLLLVAGVGLFGAGIGYRAARAANDARVPDRR